jgi:hypothetical protein
MLQNNYSRNIFLAFGHIQLSVLLFLSSLRNSLWPNRILNHWICIVIRAIELQVELQLRFFQLQVMLQLGPIYPNR